jgi:hypothetical protein
MYDCVIDFEEDTQPPFRPIYNLCEDEFATLQKYIGENFENKFIQHSKYSTDAFILFVKK